MDGDAPGGDERGGDESGGEGNRSPAAAFALLGDETRVGILRALWEAQVEDGDPVTRRPVPFAELRERVGVRDSGRFNYHLGRLVGPFVRRTDEGYALRHAGMRVVGAALEGAYARSRPAEAVPVDDPCPDHGGRLEARYADERASLVCADCGEALSSFGLPPGTLDGYDPDDYPELFDRWIGSLVERAKAGFCSLCAGRTRPTVTVGDASGRDDGAGDADGPTATFRCERCGDVVRCSLAAAVRSDPAVVAFHRDHGVDVRATPAWRLDWLHASDAYALEESDPHRFAVECALDGERLRLLVDADLTTLSADRRTV